MIYANTKESYFSGNLHEVECPNCHSTIQLLDGNYYVNQNVDCPNCGKVSEVIQVNSNGTIRIGSIDKGDSSALDNLAENEDQVKDNESDNSSSSGGLFF